MGASKNGGAGGGHFLAGGTGGGPCGMAGIKVVAIVPAHGHCVV